MLDRADPRRVFADHRAEFGIDHAVVSSRDVAAKIDAAEDDAMPGRSRQQSKADPTAGVHADPHARNAGLQRPLRPKRGHSARHDLTRGCVHRHLVLPTVSLLETSEPYLGEGGSSRHSTIVAESF